MPKSKTGISISASFADGIDITKNGFIGASAGTGKTHTIVFLVLKILRDSFLSSFLTDKAPIGIDSILVLTYTDKAASELRGRIRAEIRNQIQKLEKVQDPDPEELGELDYFLHQSARLDQAYISTIHGFAHKILKEYSLETGHPENAELVNESSPVGKALYRRMRQEFHGKYPKELLPYILTETNDSYSDGFLRKSWESFVCTLASKKAAAPESVELLPRPKPFPEMSEIKNMFGFVSEAFPRLLQLQEQLRKKIHSSTYKALASRQEEFLPALDRIIESLDPFLVIPFTLGLKKILDMKRGKSSGLEAVLLTDDELKNAKEESSFSSYILEREKFLSRTVVSSELNTVVSSFLVSLAEDIAQDSVKIKSEENQITYGDMILHLEKSLNRNPDFVSILRKRFKFGIIDEFQDTDPEQYNIFRMLFLDRAKSTESAGNLFLIGDAKQAIYGFRGADLGTYLSARMEFAPKGEFSESSVLYPELDTNRRSLPELIEAYNTLFSAKDGDWFPVREEKFPPIEYTDVKPPEVPGKALLFSDRSNRGALNTFLLSAGKSTDELKEEYSKFLAEEILHLVSEESAIWIGKDGANLSEMIGWGDIAVLIRSWGDGELLQRQLRAHGIPYTYHKQAGLFSSAEAIRIREILSCLDEEGSRDSFYKLLLSDLFGVSPEDLQDYDEYPIESREKRYLESWRGFARKKDYSGLFRSLMTESMLVSPIKDESLQDWERKITNFKQIFFLLSEWVSGKDLTLSELVGYLESKIASDEEEEDYLERDSEEDRVKILTMHACKGLEFPIVFLFGGFTGWGNTKRKFSEYSADIESQTGRIVKKRIIDMESGSGADTLQNTMNEDRRLYYVAVTRAMYKFYFPLLPEPDPKPKGALELFRKSFQAALPFFPETSSVVILKKDENSSGYTSEWIRNGNRKYTDLQPGSKKTISVTPRSVEEWPQKAEKRKIILESYSSLDLFSQTENRGYGAETERIFKTDEEYLVDSVQDELPSSSRMGNLLHQILETIDFDIFLKSDSPTDVPVEIKNGFGRLLRTYGYGTNLSQLEFFADRIVSLLWNTLRAPLPASEKGISLAEIGPSERKHEVDFFLNLNSEIPEANLLNGTIDLIFRSEGKYWILDWKSNRMDSIVSNMDPYAETQIREKVLSSYSLQLSLYSLVLDQWLKFKYGDNYDPNLLGGMYFVFLRGMDPRKIGRGVFFQKIDSNFLKISRNEIQEVFSLKNETFGEKE